MSLPHACHDQHLKHSNIVFTDDLIARSRLIIFQFSFPYCIQDIPSVYQSASSKLLCNPSSCPCSSTCCLNVHQVFLPVQQVVPMCIKLSYHSKMLSQCASSCPTSPTSCFNVHQVVPPVQHLISISLKLSLQSSMLSQCASSCPSSPTSCLNVPQVVRPVLHLVPRISPTRYL